MTQPIVINGTIHDFGSVELDLDGIFVIIAATGVDYSDGLSPEDTYGASTQALGRTRGPYKAEGSLKVTLRASQQIEAALAPSGGLYDRAFGLRVKYQDTDGGGLIVHELRGCKITNSEAGHAAGGTALEITHPLSVAIIVRNGRPPFVGAVL